MIAGPEQEKGHWVWSAGGGGAQGAEVRFVGRGPEPRADPAAVPAALIPEAPPLAWARQIHSDRVLAALPGECGEGDALVSGPGGPALCVVTADCVPVLLAGPEGIAAVHAGWRGLAADVIGRTVEEAVRTLGADPTGWTAWIGPAIGPCCYEVSPEVAEQVVAASDPAVALPGPAGKPHLDLHAAARRQLERAGIKDIDTVPTCTRCDTQRLWSYRREGKAAGRNLALIWRS
ncbi:MAG TPA: peptidoglycan editing factor PgeF [Thermoanaerobaculia bacterium]|nr:peptidoglycan editing factor PgeF [Thermoanaerobaculia bacterium]